MKKKKSLYEVKKDAVDDFMRVYDKGSRDDVFMYYNEVVDTTADMAIGYGKKVGEWKGRFFGLLIGGSIWAGVAIHDAIKKRKEEKEIEKKIKEIYDLLKEGNKEST